MTVRRMDDGESGALCKFLNYFFHSQFDFQYEIKIAITLIFRSQPISEGSTAPTDDEIYDQVLGTRPYYVRDLRHGITAPSSSPRLGLTSMLPAMLN